MQTFCESEKKVNTDINNNPSSLCVDDNDIGEHLIKLIKDFYNRHNLNRYFIYNNYQDSLNEFVSISIWYLYNSNKIKKYDSCRSKLSTYIYYILGQQYMNFVIMINYGCSYTRARKIVKIKKDSRLSEEEKETILSQLLIGYDNTCSLNDTFADKDGKENLELIDTVKDDKDYLEDVEFKENIQNFYKWLDTTKSLNVRRKKIVKDYIKYHNISKVAELNGCSKQNVSYVVQKLKTKLNEMTID